MADAVAQLTSEYLDLVFETFPTAATVFGRHEHDGRLEDLSAGRLDDFAPAVEAGADAVLAASVFHFGTLRIGDVKRSLAEAGHPVR